MRLPAGAPRCRMISKISIDYLYPKKMRVKGGHRPSGVKGQRPLWG